jgi:hypothetical protein
LCDRPICRHLPPYLITPYLSAEACGTSHYWARELIKLGHEVRLMPPAYVKPYVKRGKTDAADAEAVCEAVTRPTMRFVPVKSPEQQAAHQFRSGRQFAAWLGLTPLQKSSGGKRAARSYHQDGRQISAQTARCRHDGACASCKAKSRRRSAAGGSACAKAHKGSAQNRSTLTHTVGSRATKNQPAPYMPPSWALDHPQSNRKLGLLRIDNEVTFITHTSATDVFDPEDHNKVLDSPTAATSALVINPG